MQLVELMQLNSMDKQQLVELCNALYELLQQRQAPAPAFTFIPQVPYVPYVTTNPMPLGGITFCSNESTQQELFGVK
jgi:hypothetical protein